MSIDVQIKIVGLSRQHVVELIASMLAGGQPRHSSAEAATEFMVDDTRVVVFERRDELKDLLHVEFMTQTTSNCRAASMGRAPRHTARKPTR